MKKAKLPPELIWVSYGITCGLTICADTTKVKTSCPYCDVGTCKVGYQRYIRGKVKP